MTGEAYRDPALVKRLADAIAARTTRPWTIMEVCGGQTHAIVRHGLDAILPASLELLHGPGCPVCVTPLETIDRAHAIASKPGVVFCSYGDMLRVPGTHGDLLALKSRGADVRIVYSPLDAVALARASPDREVVFFAVGFETTAPANAMAVKVAHREGLTNFSVLVSHVLVPPAMASILQAEGNRVQGFLGPGQVCTVMGVRQMEALSANYRVPVVVTGFEPADLLQGVLALVTMLERGEVGVETAYSRAVTADGNRDARSLVEEVFDVCGRRWRGIGMLPKSGLRLAHAFRAHDAERKLDVVAVRSEESRECISGRVLRGLAKPTECAAFGGRCTPEHPLGATMVSSEGACAAYHRYRSAEARA